MDRAAESETGSALRVRNTCSIQLPFRIVRRLPTVRLHVDWFAGQKPLGQLVGWCVRVGGAFPLPELLALQVPEICSWTPPFLCRLGRGSLSTAPSKQREPTPLFLLTRPAACNYFVQRLRKLSTTHCRRCRQAVQTRPPNPHIDSTPTAAGRCWSLLSSPAALSRARAAATRPGFARKGLVRCPCWCFGCLLRLSAGTGRIRQRAHRPARPARPVTCRFRPKPRHPHPPNQRSLVVRRRSAFLPAATPGPACSPKPTREYHHRVLCSMRPRQWLRQETTLQP